jgi:uncharacterized protein (TIGR04255 family)
MTDNVPLLPRIPERRYQHPPLVEALCEISFTGSQWHEATPQLFYDRVRDDYPQRSQFGQVAVDVNLGTGQAATRTNAGDVRNCFARADRSRLLQLTRDLLVVNQLPPYTHYESWSEWVHSAIAFYRELAAPSGINHIGLRYINRVSIPGVAMNMEEYFRVYPQIPEELGGAHGVFMLQVYMLPVCRGHQLTLTLGMNPTAQPADEINFLVDLFDVVQLAGRDAFGEVRRLMDEAHANIVHTFEQSITDATRALFGEITYE